MPREARQIKLRGKVWRLEFVPRLDSGAYGECDEPDRPKKGIRIATNQSKDDMMDTLIHETLHACLPDLSEDAIHDTASDISTVLTRLGAKIEYPNE